MKTILCSNYQKEYIYEDLAKHNHGVVANVLVVPLSVALGEKHTDKYAALLKISHTLKKRSDEFPIYQKMFDYPAFIQEIFQFVLECIQRNIQIDDLPETNEQEKELKEIIRILLDIPFVEKENVKNKETAIQKLQQGDIEVYPFFEADPYYVEILEQLKDKEKRNDSIASQKHLRYALSTRREIEAIAQDIATYRRPCNLVLTSWKTQYPVVQQVFARYEIPFSTVHHDVSARLIQRYVALVNLAYRKNKEALMKALYIDAFGVDDQKQNHSLFTVLKYLDQVLVDVECPKHLSQFLEASDVFKKESVRYAYFEERADELFNSIQQDLDSLMKASTFEEILMKAFEIIRNQKILQNKHELKEGRQLRNVLQSILTSEKHDVENIPFIMHMLQGIHSDSAVFIDAICTVTDLTHPVRKQEVTYVIGCSGKNYPGFPVHNGLFDEDYLAKIPSYPSMNQRYGYYMNALQWIDSSAEEIYYSYSTNDYQGKEMQLAYEVQSKVDMKKENTPWPVLIVDNHVEVKHELTPETAQQLFLDEKGMLNGSVSTVESYYRNPYGYFIQKGLGIIDQEFSALDPITIGNIQHHFMYTLLSSYKNKYMHDSAKRKQYALQEDGTNILTTIQIKEALRPYFDVLKMTHPNEQYLYDISLERLADSLSKFMTFMHDLEKDSSFIPEYFEYRLPETMIGNVNIRGIIDRIDLYQDLIRIIDYKSSVLSISEEEVKQGLRLQMLTYMMIVTNNLQGKKYNPTAVQYISMKDETIDLNRIYNKCGDMPKQALLNSLEEDFIKSRKCAVWIFNEHRDDVDIDARHIKSPKNIYDFNKIQAYIEGIYANFHEQVLSGNIKLSPIENTTLPYMAMYHFNGEYRIPTAVEVEGIPTDIPFKLDKEEIAAKGAKEDENL